MTDEELVEALRQTFRDKADAVQPSSGWAPVPRPRSRRVRRPGRRLALASLGAALAAGAAAAIVTLNDHPSPAHNVSVAGQTSTPPPPATAAGHTPPASSPVSSAPPTSAPAVTTAPPIPVPTGFQPLSVTFVSARTGWVLGTAPCRTSTCTTLVRTTDGGATWSEVSQPPITLNPSSPSSATWVRFVNLDTGWIVVPSGSQTSTMWTTGDGGKSWTQEPNPGGASATVLALEASNGLVHLVDLEAGTGADRIFTSPVGGQDWTPSPVAPTFGGGPVPSSQMVLVGGAGWVVDLNRTVVSGVRLGAKASWTDWNPPCSNANGPGSLAASSTTNLYAVCDEGVWGTPASGTTPNSEWLYASSNGGDSFAPVGPLPGGSGGGMITAAPGTATVVYGTESGIIATFDGGKSWQVVSTVGGITYVGFTTASQGVAVSQQSVGSSEPRMTVLMTRDGGRTWTPITF
jgi:Photosynthesis system II assembly factor YCF48